jgi:hypothetical protein
VCFYGCPHNYAVRAGGAVSYNGRGIVKIRSKRRVVSPPLFASYLVFMSELQRYNISQ